MTETGWHPPYKYGFNPDGPIILTRFCYSSMGTFGILTYGDFKCYTVERPWVDNEKYVSCIPEYDNYRVQFYDSPKFGRVLAISGDTVSIYESPEHQRSAILFHVANTMDDLEGCIGCGNALGYVNNRWAVLSSRATTEKLFSLIDQNKEVKLIIKQYIPSQENLI